MEAGPRRSLPSRAAAVSSSDGATPVLGESGFSILEVVISLVILMTVLVAVSSLLVTSFKVGANSRYRQVATEIATSNLDYQVQVGATTLVGDVGDTALSSVASAGQTYVVEMEISPYTSSNASACANPNGGLAMLKITVWVTWANVVSGTKWWQSGNSSSTGLLVSETTLLALPSTAFNGNDGSILVDITGATGSTDGIAGVTVSATYGTTTYSAVTTSSGCALFANLTPGNWVIQASAAGYIDNLNDWSTSTNSASPLSSTQSVVAGNVSSLTFTYDKEGRVTPTYSVTLAGATPWLPTGINSMPLTFYTSASTTSPPNGYVAASPALVFPFSNSPNPSYHVVAGSCGTESSPAGTTDAGATTDGAAVTLTPGGQATPVIALTPLDIVVSHNGTAVSNASISAAVSSSDANCGTGTLAMPTLGLGTSCIPGGPVTVPPSSCASLASYRRHSQRRKSRSETHTFLVYACNYNCPSTTTLTSNQSGTTAYGTPITFTANVTCNNGSSGCSGSPNGGTVTFTAGATTLGSATANSSGVATFTTNSSAPVPVGSPTSVTASFGGTGAWSSSTSSNKSQTVTASGTSTALASSPNPGTYGAATLTATVTATSPSTATPTGTINFESGGSTITGCGAVALTSGSATCPLAGVGSGSYSLTAVFTPSTSPTNFVTSTSSTLPQTVTAATTTTTVTSSSFLNASSFGTSVTFTATVAPVSGYPATGTIAFKANGTVIPGCTSVTLSSSGVATCATSALASGSDTITAVYTPTSTTQFTTSTGTMTQLVYLEGTTPSIETGLPYGSWILTVSYTPTVGGTTYTATYTMLINQAGIYVNGVQSTSSPIQLAD
jgi:Tfp pilus assembly protein PilV